MRQKRYPLLLDADYPPERSLLKALESIPEGEGAGFMRAIVLLGHRELQKEAEMKPTTSEAGGDGAGTR